MALFYALYGVVAYLVFLATFVYAIGFVGNFPLLSRTIDSGMTAPLLETLVVDLALLGLFAVQHSVMARRGFKRWWIKVVPEAVERSTFVLAATAALALLLWQWRPIAEPVLWSVSDPAARFGVLAVFWAGWGVLLVSTFLLNHFELFGLHQVWANTRGQSLPEPALHTPMLYRHVRHPIYLAFWATPQMTAGHLLFAAACTAYILIGIWFEERDLVTQFGQRYEVYRQQVGLLFPKLGARDRKGPAQP